MRSSAVFLGLVALALASIATLAYPTWLFTNSLGFEFKFHRVANRIAMLVVVVGYVLVARRLKVADRDSLGFALPAQRFCTETASALLLGVLLMLPILATMLMLDARHLKAGVDLSLAGWLKLILAGAFTGLGVALIEETLVRGAMQTAIAREAGTRFAIVFTSLFYAAFHFLGRYRVAAANVHPGSGLDMLSYALNAFAHPLAILDAFLCLTAVGVLLGMVRALTGNIAACVGLHAAWVAVIFIVRHVSQRDAASPVRWLMSNYDGFIGWLVLGWTFVMGLALYRRYRPGSSVRTHFLRIGA